MAGVLNFERVMTGGKRVRQRDQSCHHPKAGRQASKQAGGAAANLWDGQVKARKSKHIYQAHFGNRMQPILLMPSTNHGQQQWPGAENKTGRTSEVSSMNWEQGKTREST